MKSSKFSTIGSRLYTPGPTQVTPEVRLAPSQTNYGSREPDFVKIIVDTNKMLLKIAGVSDEYCSILIQGSGTYGVESVIQSVVPSEGRVLVVSNGSFGERMAKISAFYIPESNLKHVQCDYYHPIDINIVRKEIESFKPTHLLMVHSETSSGVINDVRSIGLEFAKNKDLVFIVDGMSSFGGCVLDMEVCGVDFYITSPNKCLESIAGVAIIIAKKKALVSHSRTYVLDIVDQNSFFEKWGMFRTTPPMEVVVALHEACKFLLEETIEKRQERYMENTRYVRKEMKRIGFKGYLSDEVNGHIVSVYDFPSSKNFRFSDFYEKLCERRCRIYIFPGKRLDRDVIRIGTIGANNVDHFKILIRNIEEISNEFGFFGKE